MASVVISLDKADAYSADALRAEAGAQVIEASPLATEAALIIAVLSSTAAALNVIAAALNSKTASRKNVIRIAGRNYDLVQENRDKIIAALDEHFNSP